MTVTLSELRNDTRMLLDETTAADWTNIQVDAAINYAYHEVVASVVKVYEDYYVKTDQMNTTADRQEYDQTTDGFPTDFFKIRRVEINYDTSDSNSSPRRALPVKLDDIDRDLGNTAIGNTPQRNPGYYLIGQGSNLKLGFIPIPDETGTNAIKIWYVYFPSDLSANTDTIDIPYPERYGRLISYGAAGDLLRKGQQEEVAAARYRAEFEAALQKMIEELEDRTADDIRGVTDTVDMDLDFDRYHQI